MPTYPRTTGGPGLAALIAMLSVLLVTTGCAQGATTRPAAHATATAAATATHAALTDPAVPPAIIDLVTAEPQPSLCAPAITITPLPATLATLYAGTSDGTITALNASDGSKRWSYPTNSFSIPLIVPTTSLIVVSAGNQVLALGATDGTLKWQVNVPNSANNGGGVPFVLAGGVVYAPGADGVLRALDATTGKELWRAQTPGADSRVSVDGSSGVVVVQTSGMVYGLRTSDGTSHWSVVAQQTSLLWTPLVANGLVYTALTSTTLAALNVRTGAIHWRASLGTQRPQNSLLSAVAAGTGLYVNAAHAIYALNASTGALCWAAPSCGDGATSTPLLDATLLYETCSIVAPSASPQISSAVFAVDAHIGAARWNLPVNGSPFITPASTASGMLYLNSSQTVAVKTATGTLAWSFPAQPFDSFVASLPVVSEATVYAGFADHTVHALNAANGSAQWVYTTSGPVYTLVAGA